MEKTQKVILIRLIISSILFCFSFFKFLGDTWSFIISILSFALIGFDVVIESIVQIFKRKFFDEKFLMVIASIGAFAIGEFHEAVAVMLLYQLGEFLQDLAVDHSKNSIEKLINIMPSTANIEKNGKILKVSPSSLNINDEIIVFAGERVPLDGVILSGKTSFDTSTLTGESLPKSAEEGDEILAGFLNLTETITVKVTKTFESSSMSQILKLVKESEKNSAKSEKFITKFAKFYTPSVVLIALLLLAFPPLVFHQSWKIWIHRALLFLVVSCPCALVISIPLAFFVGIGTSAKNGILIKSSNSIETLSKTKTFGFDKTGTVTTGNFVVSKVCAFDGKENNLLKLCAMAEYGNNHPISRAIVKFAEENNINFPKTKEQIVHAGLGIEAEFKGKKVYVGNHKFMTNLGFNFDKIEADETIVFVASTKPLGYILILDEIKSSCQNAIEKMRKLGAEKLVMLSGDSKNITKTISEKLKFDECYGELLPTEKSNLIKNFKSSGFVGFVGDGVNDALVLKTSDLGISMAKLGSDIAIDSADIVLLDDNLEKIPEAMEISKRTMKVVKQNIVFSITFKMLMLILGATGIISSMWFAVIGDVGVSLIAILNSIRILHKKNSH